MNILYESKKLLTQKNEQRWDTDKIDNAACDRVISTFSSTKKYYFHKCIYKRQQLFSKPIYHTYWIANSPEWNERITSGYSSLQ